MDKVKEVLEGLKKDAKHYGELKKLKDSAEFETYFELLKDTAAKKLIDLAISNNIKDWNDFCIARGEIRAYLYPIQEVGGSEEMVKRLKDEISKYDS